MAENDNGYSRRSFLRVGGLMVGATAGAAAFMQGGGAAQAVQTMPTASAFRIPSGPRLSGAYLTGLDGSVIPDSWKAKPFALSQVTLDQSVFTRAQQQMLNLAREYPADRILAVFRTNAGIDTKGARPPGGWEGPGHADEEAWGPGDYPGKNAPRANLLRGHFGGHFLSMMALAYAGTGDQDFKTKIDYLVDALGECQDALAATGRYSHPGFLAAYGEWQFSALEDYALYGEIWAPYYTAHKIMAGLLECYRLAGSAKALEIVAAMGKWIHSRLRDCTPDQLERMWSIYIAGEYGGMNEVMVDLYAITKDNDFLDCARFFDLNSLVDACAAGEDILDGKHANQHIPQFSGYAKLFDYTGETRYRDAVTNFWGMIVPGRMYAHGGTGEGELWGPANTVAGDIGGRNSECCAAYNMLKVSRLLFFQEPDARYMDYYERTVLNHILGSRRNVDSDTSPEVLYMYPVHPGAMREYNNVGTCCGGTGLENHLKYQDSVYFQSADQTELYVNLYVASTLDWSENGFRVVQRTAFPQEGSSEISIDGTGQLKVRLRAPSWAENGFTVSVNGSALDTQATPGTYLLIDRVWSPGDVISIDMPLSVHAEPAIDDPTIQSLRHGPVTLLAVNDSAKYQKFSLYSGMSLDKGLENVIVPAGQNRFWMGSQEFEPAYSGAHTKYHMYFERSEPVIAFGGVSSAVANPARGDKTTFLDVLWASGPFANRGEFLAAVQDTSRQFVNEGLLGRRDRQKVLIAAGKARL